MGLQTAAMNRAGRRLLLLLALGALALAGCQSDPAPEPPPAPTGVAATRWYSLIQLGWTPVSGADRYDVYSSDVPGVAATGGERSKVSVPPAAFGVDTVTTYYFAVAGERSGREGPRSGEITVPPPALVSGAGTVHAGVEVGCWTIQTADTTYQPESLDLAYQTEGLAVTFEGYLRLDSASGCMEGLLIELTSITAP